MSFDLALRLTEVLLALCLIQQSAEHLAGPRKDRLLFSSRIGLSAALLVGLAVPWVCLGLLALGLVYLHRYQGPYNGGSDRMSLLILVCLCATHWVPPGPWQEIAFGYLALQLVLSYFISGWVKVVNADWRSGQALQDVFSFSAYPVSEGLRAFAHQPRLMLVMSWAVMGFELLFPASLISQPTLILALTVAATFHFANACLFGLKPFFLDLVGCLSVIDLAAGAFVLAWLFALMD